MRPSDALSRRKKLAWLLAVFLPSIWSETLEAWASQPNEVRVVMGERSLIHASVNFRADCSGCSGQDSVTVEDAVLTLMLTPEVSSQRTVTVIISAGEHFVSPVTGVVRIVDAKPPERLEREFKGKCSEPAATIESFKMTPG